MTTQYYAVVLNTRTIAHPFKVFREVVEPGKDWRTEVYDPDAGEWREDMYYGTYTVGGETGAEPITKAQADAFTDGATP
jgi:hypothetical protein